MLPGLGVVLLALLAASRHDRGSGLRRSCCCSSRIIARAVGDHRRLESGRLERLDVSEDAAPHEARRAHGGHPGERSVPHHRQRPGVLPERRRGLRLRGRPRARSDGQRPLHRPALADHQLRRRELLRANGTSSSSGSSTFSTSATSWPRRTPSCRRAIRMLYDGEDGRIFENPDVLPRFFAARNVILEFRDTYFRRAAAERPKTGRTRPSSKSSSSKSRSSATTSSSRVPTSAPMATTQILEASADRLPPARARRRAIR